jgi:rRNA-processing protein FCF1
MVVLMDTDCLIKLTKAGLKEVVCQNFTIFVPPAVKQEALETGDRHPDADVIKKNILAGLINVRSDSKQAAKRGEDGIFEAFSAGSYETVCSDDRKFIRRMRVMGVPYVTPAVFIPLLVERAALTIEEAYERLDILSSFISDEEAHTVKLFLERWGSR